MQYESKKPPPVLLTVDKLYVLVVMSAYVSWILTNYFVLAADCTRYYRRSQSCVWFATVVGARCTQSHVVKHSMYALPITFECFLCVQFVNQHTGRDAIIWFEHLHRAAVFVLLSPTVTL